MPETTTSGDARDEELPSTLQRSNDKAQRTWAKTHDSAVETYDGDEQRATRVAWAAVKHTHEKVGDHWEPKDNAGPTDAPAGGGGGPPRWGGRRPSPPPRRSAATGSRRTTRARRTLRPRAAPTRTGRPRAASTPTPARGTPAVSGSGLRAPRD